MKKGKIQYWISTKEVKNPWYDKRCKYDIQQYAKFDTGTKIVSWTTRETYAGYEVDVVTYKLFNGIKVDNLLYDKNGDKVTSWNVPDTFGLVSYEPTDVERLNQEVTSYEGSHSILLKRLLNKGYISYSSIVDEYELYLKEED
jgi:hypothetical protein